MSLVYKYLRFFVFSSIFRLAVLLSGRCPPGDSLSISSPLLRLEVVTDQAEYRLGETINATFYIVNPLPLPVRISPYRELTYGGNSDEELNKTYSLVISNPMRGVTILIPPRSKYKVAQASFKPTLLGDFAIEMTIDGRRAELTVSVK
jgi:hypothetical protein